MFIYRYCKHWFYAREFRLNYDEQIGRQMMSLPRERRREREREAIKQGGASVRRCQWGSQDGRHVHLIGGVCEIWRRFDAIKASHAFRVTSVVTAWRWLVQYRCGPSWAVSSMIVPVPAAAGGSHWTMFSKKLHVDVKKSTLKIQDVKKDSTTRFKHLKIVLGENIVFCAGWQVAASQRWVLKKRLIMMSSEERELISLVTPTHW